MLILLLKKEPAPKIILKKTFLSGKTIENLRKRTKVRVGKDKEKSLKYINRPTCVNWIIFNKKLVAIHQRNTCLTLNKQIYVGFTVLEVSKLEMDKFHYDFMIKNFDVRLLFTDTDSLCYEVNNWNMYDKIYEHRDLFDLSNYSVDSKYSCRDNKKVVAKMKDEYGGIFISKLVGLK